MIIEKSIIETDSRSRVSIIDSRNWYACTGSSKHRAAWLIIKLKPLTSVHASRSAVLLCVGLPTGLPSRPTGRPV